MIIEHLCKNDACEAYGAVVEHFYHHDPGEIRCEACGQPVARLVSLPNVVFTGPITARYNDKKLEGAHQEGHWAWRVRSSTERDAKGNPIPQPVLIDSFQKRKEFMKSEGLIGIEETGNAKPRPDGKWGSGVGTRGQWV